MLRNSHLSDINRISGFFQKKNEEINEEKRQQNKQKDRLNVKNRATSCVYL